MLVPYKKPFYKKTGNLIDMAMNGEFDVIVHGCNCFNTMGAGIAAEIARRIPAAALRDKETVWGDSSKLGNFTLAKFKNDFDTDVFIVNAYTQYKPGRHFDIEHLKKVTQQLKSVFQGTRIGFPYIGCGIGGGHWPDVKSVLKSLADKQSDTQVTVVHFKQ